MVDKSFDIVIYEDSNGNVKGVFQEFLFATSGRSGPYNSGRGQNLTVNRGTRKVKVPHIGFRTPLILEQDKKNGVPITEIVFTTPQTRKDQYGVLFCVKFLDETGKALESKSAYTVKQKTEIETGSLIKSLGSITLNENTYQYFLVNVRSDYEDRTETSVQFNFTSSKLKNGKMAMEIFEGFTFNNFTDNDYKIANMTNHFLYPHQKDFDKHKFKDVMVGDVLLAGTEQTDGTVTANSMLRLTEVNLTNAIPERMTVYLPYISPKTAKDKNNGWCHVETSTDYPQPVFPCQGGKRLIITLLTHNLGEMYTLFPKAAFQYRLIIYKDTNTKSEALLDRIKYKDVSGSKPTIKSGGPGGNVFQLNHELSYTPAPSCIGFSLEFKQVEPDPDNVRGNILKNKSQLFISIEQEL